MNRIELHGVQATTLYSLRHIETARFSELMKLTTLTSDEFKFHLRRLATLGYLTKTSDGRYKLTAVGKEFANNLDDAKRVVQKQPKLSVLLTVPRLDTKGVPSQQYLFQQRKRNPYFGFWGSIGGPVQWDETFEETATRELNKQTGLTADFTVRLFYRQRDYDKESGTLFEDKLFVVLEATNVRGRLTNAWHGGTNQWLSAEEFKAQDNYFTSSYEVIELLRSNTTYTSQKAVYAQNEY